MIFGREPSLFLALLAAILQLAIGFGVHLSPEQVSLVGAAELAIVSFCVRQSVTPVTPKGASV